MAIFDELEGLRKAVDKAAAEHPDQVKDALHKLESVIDEKTGSRHHDEITQASTKAELYIDQHARSQ